MTYSTPTLLEYRGLAHAGGIEGELNFMARDKTWKYISVCLRPCCHRKHLSLLPTVAVYTTNTGVKKQPRGA